MGGSSANSAFCKLVNRGDLVGWLRLRTRAIESRGSKTTRETGRKMLEPPRICRRERRGRRGRRGVYGKKPRVFAGEFGAADGNWTGFKVDWSRMAR